jgi:lactoylglutathione lyase
VERSLVRIGDLQWVELRPEQIPESDRLLQYGFQVEDAEALRIYLWFHGIPVPNAVSIGPTGNRSFTVRDPDGHSIEFIEYLAEGWPTRVARKAPGSKVLSNCMMHIGFDVYSMDKAMTFYRDTLGYVEIWRGTGNGEHLSWVQLRLPDDERNNYIEFMLYDEPLSLERLGVFNHFGLEVPSVPAAAQIVTKLEAFKAYPRALEHKVGTCRHRLSNLFDPDGTRAEFMERSTFDGSVTPSSSLPPPR